MICSGVGVPDVPVIDDISVTGEILKSCVMFLIKKFLTSVYYVHDTTFTIDVLLGMSDKGN